ncbi:hypothetical protein GTP58_13305 [Duganella sp. CY15W]|uniref:TniQ family protein n=1 Tax=Duganella sp. CY15W TaxID=2692172 RepID=UPI001371E903|nr:TniQ family protein [Duganella sp. CY15W]MYM29301.1 hypothetical protein [Duganella sp. CY15W]
MSKSSLRDNPVIRLPFIPAPYPNEIFGSWLGRIRHLNQAGAWDQLKLDCGLTDRWLGCFDIPDNHARHQRLFEALGTNLGWVLKNLTTYPYFEALGAGVDLVPGTTRYAIHDTKLMSKLGVSRIPNASSMPRYCPCCIASDITEVGEPFWHREHQLPNVFYCVTHRQLLKATCGTCNVSVSGVDQNKRLREFCVNGHSLQRSSAESEVDHTLYSLSKFSVQSLAEPTRSYKKPEVLDLVHGLLRIRNQNARSPSISTLLCSFYRADRSQIYKDYVEVHNPADLDYSAFFLLKKRDAQATVPWMYAVLLALECDWSSLDSHFTDAPLTPPRNHSPRRVHDIDLNIDSARSAINDTDLSLGQRGAPFKAYWYLALYDHEWLKSRYPGLKPVPSILEDRATIAKNILSEIASGSSVLTGKQKGPFTRAEIRDKLWQNRICGLFEIVNKPSEFEPKSDIFEERKKIVFNAVQVLLAEPGPPQHIDARRIAEKIGLSHETVRSTISRSPEILASLQAYRENFINLRLIWALRDISDKGEPVTHTSISLSLKVNHSVGITLLEKLKEILSSDAQI